MSIEGRVDAGAAQARTAAGARARRRVPTTTQKGLAPLHRALLWAAAAALVILILWTTAASAQQMEDPRRSGARPALSV